LTSVITEWVLFRFNRSLDELLAESCSRLTTTVCRLGVALRAEAAGDRLGPTTGRCPMNCPITPVRWLFLVPLRRNYGEQNAM
ncbi:MAG: hypothetical protein LC808_30065, partial [Actinobacteria bacterium]|nr:hypothetical protein [Actinomycetota bacterium]